MRQSWQELFADWSWVKGEGKFPIPAYSEFMPPPRIGQKPYGAWETASPFAASDPYGFSIPTRERGEDLALGLALIGHEMVEAMDCLAKGRPARGIGRHHLQANPYWPELLASHIAGRPKPEHYLFLSPLAVSKTQDDKGRVRWTLFGSSDEGPEKGFWKSFFTAPGVEIPADAALATLRRILESVHGEAPPDFAALKQSGFRILPSAPDADFPHWNERALPGWTNDLLLGENEAHASVRMLLTFRPFASLGASLQDAYLTGALDLLPFPGSLVFWGSPFYRRLAREFPHAMQIPLLEAVPRHSGKGIRVPQSGWLHWPRPDHLHHDEGLGAERSTYRRSHRWERKHRDDPPSATAHEDHVYKVLFSVAPDDVGLYGKPMARNAQLWSSDFRLVLDGPPADGKAISRAEAAILKGGSFGYRFQFPPMMAGAHTLIWHLPLIAWRDAATGEPRVISDALNGYLTATDQTGQSELELWPRLLPFMPPQNTVSAGSADTPLTFHHTARRDFEVEYWNTIAFLAEGRYLNKNTGDCVTDPATEKHLIHHQRDLDHLGDHLIEHYRRLFAAHADLGALAGYLPFHWQTDFAFPWMGGWLGNQTGKKQERNIVAVIPGTNRKEAVIMADHYDTAYMEDLYGYGTNVHGDRSRVAAAGADDNHSATATLMLAAPVFLELSRAGKLACDIWLVHLTGEEFPSDCLGARHLTEMLVETSLKLNLADGGTADLSQTRVRGLYVLDMIAHNNDRARDIFQIAPGGDGRALWLATEAKIASELWKRQTEIWNATSERAPLGRGVRRAEGNAPPAMARFLAPKGEIRPHDHPASTLFNTDGQIFSDAGIPAVLFMENYDIERKGYHDSLDTLANIDLDYGAAVAAIAMEAVARAASRQPPSV